MTKIEHKEEIKEDNIEKNIVSKYQYMDTESLINELNELIKKPIQSIKNKVSEIKFCFDKIIDQDREKNKKEFLDEGGEEIDFDYRPIIIDKFYKIYKKYRTKNKKYYENLTLQNENNIKNRELILKELKAISEGDFKINKLFFENLYVLKDRWRSIGKISNFKKNDELWSNYKHYLQVINDYIRLNDEFKSFGIKYSLEQRDKVIEKAKQLLEETNLKKAIEELKVLQKIWKEEINFVPNKEGEEKWQEFKNISNQIYDKNRELIAKQKEEFKINLIKKRELCDKIQLLLSSTKDINTHDAWREKSIEFEEIIKKFDSIGIVPNQYKKEILDTFMTTKRTFIKDRNIFYKEHNKEVAVQLDEYNEFITQLNTLKDNTNWMVDVEKVKQLQRDWKAKGGIQSKKYFDLKRKFEKMCDTFFDRYKNRFEDNKEFYEGNYDTRLAFIDELQKLEILGDKEKDIEKLTEYIAKWNELGEVLLDKEKEIEQKFEKALKIKAEKMGFSLKKLEYIQFKKKTENIIEKGNKNKLRAWVNQIQFQVSKLKKESQQLENNLSFFTNSKSNPFEKEIRVNIDKLNKKIEEEQQKLSYIKTLNK